MRRHGRPFARISGRFFLPCPLNPPHVPGHEKALPCREHNQDQSDGRAEDGGEFRPRKQADQEVGKEKASPGKQAVRDHLHDTAETFIFLIEQDEDGDDQDRDDEGVQREVEDGPGGDSGCERPRADICRRKTGGQVDDVALEGCSRRGKWNRYAVCDEGCAAGGDRREAQADHERGDDGGRRPVAGSPLNESPEQVADDQGLDPGVRGHQAEAVRDHVKKAGHLQGVEQEDGAPDDQKKVDRFQSPQDHPRGHMGQVHPPVGSRRQDSQPQRDGQSPGR